MELEIIQNKIYEFRGYKVMLDFDLAEMYQVETKVLNQAVKRNIERFPEDFMFQITDVAMRSIVLNTPTDKVMELQKEMRELKQYIEETFSDYNDINEDARVQLELLNEALAEAS